MDSSTKYSGYEELKAFVQNHKQPIFKNFIKENQGNLAIWSVNLGAYSARILNGIWVERYKQVLMEVRGTAVCAKNTKFKELLWNDIMASVSRRRKLAKTYIDEGINTLTEVAPLASREAKRAIEQWSRPSSSNNGAGPPTTTHMNNSSPIAPTTATASSSRPYPEPQRETNEFLFSVAAKKLRNEVDPLETAQLQTYVTEGHTIRDKMTNHAIHLLSKKNLTLLETELVKLLLCSVVNLLDPLAHEAMKAIFTDKQLENLMKNDTFDQEKYGIDLMALAKLNEIVENCKSLESLLKTVLRAKIDLIDNKERDSDMYKMLCILETWRVHGHSIERKDERGKCVKAVCGSA
ncbi:hypothetical protein BJV82DRAFT_381489 [Fennellomyces sp. T-0311]|nr:hypothetical protein BJV82DRAFT_381489 [Fennellomyces sp. T-0311]